MADVRVAGVPKSALALDVYTDIVRDEFCRLADSIEAGDL